MKKEHNIEWIRFDKMCQELGTDKFLIRSFCLARAAKCVHGKNPNTCPECNDEDAAKRAIIFDVSTSGEKRDGHEIDQNGWHLANYRANPVIMWAHSRDSLPIANSLWEKVISSPAMGGKVLRSQASFIPPDLNPFAEQVYRMYQERMLNAVSVGWRTLEHEYKKDAEGYITGIKFKRMDMLEYSAVPIPADPQALQRGVQTGLIRDVDQFDISKMLKADNEQPVFYLGLGSDKEREEKATIVDMGAKTGGFEDEVDRAVVPYKAYTMKSKDAAWDGSGARKRLASWAKEGEGINFARYKVGFLYVDASKSDNLGSYKGPHHDVDGGAVVTVPRGVYAAAQRLQQGAFDVPAGDIPGMKKHIERHYAELNEKAPWERKIGESYEGIHTALRNEEYASEEERNTMRQTAEILAKQIYGESRLPESWENQYDTCESPILVLIARTLETAFTDREQATDAINSVLDAVKVTIVACEQSERNFAKMAELIGGADDAEVMQRVQGFVDYRASLEAKEVERIDTLILKLEEIRTTKEPTTEKSEEKSETLLTREEEFRTLFRELMSPVAGVEDGKKTE